VQLTTVAFQLMNARTSVGSSRLVVSYCLVGIPPLQVGGGNVSSTVCLLADDLNLMR